MIMLLSIKMRWSLDTLILMLYQFLKMKLMETSKSPPSLNLKDPLQMTQLFRYIS